MGDWRELAQKRLDGMRENRDAWQMDPKSTCAGARNPYKQLIIKG